MRDPDNLEHLIQNDQFLGVLTRLFREEANKVYKIKIKIKMKIKLKLSQNSVSGGACAPVPGGG